MHALFDLFANHLMNLNRERNNSRLFYYPCWLQIKTLKKKCDNQELEIRNLENRAKGAAKLAAAESSKSNIAMEFAKSITKEVYFSLFRCCTPIQIILSTLANDDTL